MSNFLYNEVKKWKVSFEKCFNANLPESTLMTKSIENKRVKCFNANQGRFEKMQRENVWLRIIL